MRGAELHIAGYYLAVVGFLGFKVEEPGRILAIAFVWLGFTGERWGRQRAYCRLSREGRLPPEGRWEEV